MVNTIKFTTIMRKEKNVMQVFLCAIDSSSKKNGTVSHI